MVLRSERRDRPGQVGAEPGGRGSHASGAVVPVLEGTAAGCDSRAAVANGDVWTAVRASVDPLLSGKLAQRVSRSRTGRGGGRQARLPTVHRRSAAPVQGTWAGAALVREKADSHAQPGPGRAQHGAFILRAAGHGVPQSRPARRSRPPEVRPGFAHRAQGPARRRRHEIRSCHRRRDGRQPGERDGGPGHGSKRRAARVARFRVQLLRRRAALPQGAVSQAPHPRTLSRGSREQARADPGGRHAADDEGVALPAGGTSSMLTRPACCGRSTAETGFRCRGET